MARQLTIQPLSFRTLSANCCLQRGRRDRTISILIIGLAVMVWSTTPLFALEKYGRPLPSMEQPENEQGAEEMLFGGYFLTAGFVRNPTFAARPDNTGLVGLRHMLHLETDLYKQYLTVYTDQNFFSDRTRGWIELSEWDGTYAFTGLINRLGWRIQYERDAPLDKSGIKQIYADVLATARFQATEDWAWFHRSFPQQNLSAYAGAGWLFHNSNYFARPDNTGKALFRYVAHADLDLYQNRIVMYGDMNLFTDREASSKTNPTELDWIVGLAFRWSDIEFSVYREQDQPLDRPGLVQQYWAMQLRYAFDAPKRFSK
ncbi:MAG: hypothetical protein H0W13_10455 [Nitrospirales bacterium]|nr:hypothetical protein [Nitrospirales bacterium]